MSQPRYQLVPGSRLMAVAGSSGIGWRLLGPNNRELARSAVAYADGESAVAAIDEVRVHSADGVTHIVHDPRSGQWSWQLQLTDQPVANSGRGFRYERECRYNLMQFLEAAPTAAGPDSTVVPTEFPWQRTVSLPTPTEAAQ